MKKKTAIPTMRMRMKGSSLKTIMAKRELTVLDTAIPNDRRLLWRICEIHLSSSESSSNYSSRMLT